MGNSLVKVSNMNEDIEHTIVDLGDLLPTKSHEEIWDFLKEKQLQLGKYVCTFKINTTQHLIMNLLLLFCLFVCLFTFL